jgi:peptide-methionine (R)-S-oxide reductase
VAGSVLLNKKFDMRNLLFLIIATVLFNCCHTETEKKNTMDSAKKNNPAYSKSDSGEVVSNDDEWKKILSPEVYYVARKKGTERPWTSRFDKFSEIGTYYCAVAECNFLK